MARQRENPVCAAVRSTGKPSTGPPCYELRVELYCGAVGEGRDSGPAAIKRYSEALKVAQAFGVSTYFEAHEENGVLFFDGYIYPTSRNVLAVLRALDTADVEYDNVDLPRELKGSTLSEALHTRFDKPPGPEYTGVSVNDGEIDAEQCPEASVNSGFSIRDLQDAYDDFV